MGLAKHDRCVIGCEVAAEADRWEERASGGGGGTGGRMRCEATVDAAWRLLWLSRWEAATIGRGDGDRRWWEPAGEGKWLGLDVFHGGAHLELSNSTHRRTVRGGNIAKA
ncbi:hypothetical protein Scep_011678 [Stephania cephalantha]|uniref:Uncharacterized protein n=1 Tax=Stephania cephalantha TaxID=152367 RepID=A0AAP0JFR6_9MAGN